MENQAYYSTPVVTDPGMCDKSVPLRIVASGVVAETKNVSNKRIRHDWYLIYLVNGELKIDFENDGCTVKAGDVIAIPPDTRHFCYTKGNDCVDYMWVHFTGYNADDLIEHFKIVPKTPHCIGTHHSMTEHWQRLFNSFILNDEFFPDVSTAILTEILAQFSRYIHNTTLRNSFLKSITFIHKNYADDIKISELAEMEHLSETHYRTCFRKITGISPSEYITKRRIEAATKLLESTKMSISDIATRSGYSDIYYFIRMFKKKTGTTPAKYRKASLGMIF